MKNSLSHGSHGDAEKGAGRLVRRYRARSSRRCLRRRIEFDALINHYGLAYSVRWRIRDLSLTGAFVEADAELLPEGFPIEAVLRYDYCGRAMEQRIAATVVRVDDRGVGLVFGCYDDRTYTDLVNLLYAVN